MTSSNRRKYMREGRYLEKASSSKWNQLRCWTWDEQKQLRYEAASLTPRFPAPRPSWNPSILLSKLWKHTKKIKTYLLILHTKEVYQHGNQTKIHITPPTSLISFSSFSTLPLPTSLIHCPPILSSRSLFFPYHFTFPSHSFISQYICLIVIG